MAALVAVVLALVSSAVFGAEAGAALVGAVGPRATIVIAGTVTGDSATLSRRDRFGAGDLPGGYLRLDPGGDRFVARFVYRAPGEAVDLLLALRAPARAEGRWRVEVLDGGSSVPVWNSRTGPIRSWWGDAFALQSDPGERVVIRMVGRGAPVAGPPGAGSITLAPAPGTTWQWQLSGAIDTSHAVAMYDIDLFDAPPAAIDSLHRSGRMVVCYFSAGSWENWRPDQGTFPAAVKGKTLDGWPDERWLDVRRLDLLGPIIEARLDLAVARGCDGVEPDNVDGYANSTGFPLTAAEQRRYNTWLAERAHERGLSVGLKNDLDQVPALGSRVRLGLERAVLRVRRMSSSVPVRRCRQGSLRGGVPGRPSLVLPAGGRLGLLLGTQTPRPRCLGDPLRGLVTAPGEPADRLGRGESRYSPTVLPRCWRHGAQVEDAPARAPPDHQVVVVCLDPPRQDAGPEGRVAASLVCEVDLAAPGTRREAPAAANPPPAESPPRVATTSGSAPGEAAQDRVGPYVLADRRTLHPCRCPTRCPPTVRRTPSRPPAVRLHRCRR